MAFAKEGADVVFTYYANKKAADETAEMISKYGVKALPVKCDAGSEAEVKAFIAETVAGLADRSPKQMGAVMGALKAKYGSSFDAKQANAWVKEALTG